MLVAQGFENGSALFKFAEGSAVDPDEGGRLLPPVGGTDCRLYFLKQSFSTFQPEPGFGVPERCEAYAQQVEFTKNGI
jgi:hypothetical protein